MTLKERKKRENMKVAGLLVSWVLIICGINLACMGIKLALLMVVAGGLMAWGFSKIRTKEVTKQTIQESETDGYSIKGINHCGLNDSALGDFIGTARALKSNSHDPYAIGIYIGSKRIGFLPGGNRELHERITALGGIVDADGYISKGNEDGRDFYYGKVNLVGI